MNLKKETHCTICNKTYSTSSNLKKHVKKYHPSKLNKIQSYYKNSANFNHTCKDCGKNFSYLHHFRSHKRIHQDQFENYKCTRKKCPLCDFSSYKKSEMLNHFRDIHQIVVQSKEYGFRSKEEFNKWKIDVESNSSSSYIKNAKSNKTDTVYYCCHRSGIYIPRGKGVRQLKIRGSSKINAYCPAGIRLNKDIEGSYKAVLIDNHVGHETDIGHLQLTSLERKDLATKIAAGMGFNEIIEEVRQSAHPDHTKRIHLLTRKDLCNIKTCFSKSITTSKQINPTIEKANKIMEKSCSNILSVIKQDSEKTTKEEVTKINDDPHFQKEMNLEETFTEINDTKDKKDTEIRLCHDSQHIHKEKLDEEKGKLLTKFSKHLNNITTLEELEKLKTIINSICNS